MKKILFISIWLIFGISCTLTANHPAQTTTYDIVVAQDSSGDYLTLSEAISAVPDNDTNETVIFIKKGIYKEKILVPDSKTHLTLLGEDVDSTILTYDDYSGKVIDSTTTLGTSTSYSFRVDADYFKAQNLTFENNAGEVGQAVALLVNGDKNIFYHCRLLGDQDTYYTKGYGRIYMKDCYIEGTTDFIFGRAVVVFDSCVVHSKKTSYITAASTEEEYKFGYVFFDCQLTAASGIFGVSLGRPWRPFARTVFIHSYIGRHIKASGWSEWGGNNNHETTFYAEYDCFGPRAVRTYRAPWTYELTPTEAEAYTLPNIFAQSTAENIYSDDWIPALDSLPYTPYVVFPSTTQLEDLKEAYELKVFPNPARDKAGISFELAKAEKVGLSLLNVQGKAVYEVEAQNMGAGKRSIPLDLAGLPAGQYFYHLLIGEKDLAGTLTVR